MKKPLYAPVETSAVSRVIDTVLPDHFKMDVEAILDAVWDCLCKIFPKGTIDKPQDLQAASSSYFKRNSYAGTCIPNIFLYSTLRPHIRELMRDESAMSKLTALVREQILLLLYQDFLNGIVESMKQHFANREAPEGWSMSSFIYTKVKQPSLYFVLKDTVGISEERVRPWFEENVVAAAPDNWIEKYKYVEAFKKSPPYIARENAAIGSRLGELEKTLSRRYLNKKEQDELVTVLRYQNISEGNRAQAMSILYGTVKDYLYSLAKQFHAAQITRKDFVNAGFAEIIKAVDDFDINHKGGGKFIYFAGKRAYMAMKDLAAQSRYSVNLPRRHIDFQTQLNSTDNYLSGKFNRKPTPGEIADFLEIDLESVQNQEPNIENDSASRALENFPDPVYDSEDDSYPLEWDEIQTALARLSELERAVISGLYFDELSNAALAEKLGLSSISAIVAVKMRALAKLKNMGLRGLVTDDAWETREMKYWAEALTDILGTEIKEEQAPSLLAALDERQQSVLKGLYILADTYRNLAETMDLSYQRIYQIRIAAVEKLRRALSTSPTASATPL